MRKRRFISVLMPVFNNTKFLEKSIRSVLRQTYKNFELIILDDGSTEDVHSIINSFNDDRVRVYRNDKNIGLTKSLNICLDLAKGDFIARHDSDDIIDRTKLRKQIDSFLPGVGLVGCWGRCIDDTFKHKAHKWFDKTIRVSESEIKKYIRGGNFIIGAGVMIRKGVFNKIGYYDEEIVTGQDYNMWLRILHEYAFVIVKEDLYFAMDNPDSVRRRYQFSGDYVIRKCNDLADKRPFIKKRFKQEWEVNFVR